MAPIENLSGSGAATVAAVALGLAILALVAVLFLLVRQQRLLRQYTELTRGTSGGNLEAILNDHIAQVRETATRIEDVGQLVRRLEKAANFSLQHLGVVRFNPFQDTGGDQSFAIALVDGHGNGVVLSSLHGRDATRIYAKPLKRWEATHSLTDEEKQAIALAYQKRS
jgi:HAMP domain-containing protein